MNKITNWIKEHQVAAFFILAFTITWPLFWLIYFAFPGNSLVLILAGGPLAVFSPALAAMFISAIIEPHPKLQTRKPRLIAFGVSWLISWIIMTLYYWQVVKLDLPLAAILWAVFALLPAWILSSAYAPTPGIRKHFSSLIRPRGNLIWYLRGNEERLTQSTKDISSSLLRLQPFDPAKDDVWSTDHLIDDQPDLLPNDTYLFVL
ncbi:MAG TPA: hypothetical protein VLA72_17545, partial [Anaerolineales bacterium]|nr:hypothetical protein [Anaerolineales bacterium]